MSSFISTLFRKLKSRRKRYHVYLSFCDEDSHSFATGIYTALTSNRILNLNLHSDHRVYVFWDNNWLGSEYQTLEPSDSVLNAIEECEMAVIVYSKKYTESSWCLQELEKITECRRRTTDGLIVLPVFYDGVYSSYKRLWVRRDMYGEGFHNFMDRISMEKKTSSEDEDKFMAWVAAISNEASIHDGSDYLGDWHK